MNSDDQIIQQAFTILADRLKNDVAPLLSPALVRNYLTLKLAQEEREIFGVLWLNAKNQVICCENLFYGTLKSVEVHPREIVKLALKHNAAAVIYFHNHPSGNEMPSGADEKMTDRLKEVLDLIEVDSLDHIIVGHTKTYSFAENGLM